MSQAAVEALIDRWTNEPAFRERMRQDPEGAVRAAGVELDPDEQRGDAGLHQLEHGRERHAVADDRTVSCTQKRAKSTPEPHPPGQRTGIRTGIAAGRRGAGAHQAGRTAHLPDRRGACRGEMA